MESNLFNRESFGFAYEALNSIHGALSNKLVEMPKNEPFKSTFEQLHTAHERWDQAFDNVFVVTNELHSEKVLESMKERLITGNTGIYTSGLFSLDLAAAERAHSSGDLENIIVIDRASNVRDFWSETEKIIRDNDNKDNAFQKIKELITKNKNRYFPTSGLTADHTSSLAAKINTGMSFLSTDEKYKKIRDIFCNDRFAFIQLDLCDQDSTKRLGELLVARSLTIDTLYVSNIYGLLSNDLEEALEKRNGGAHKLNFTTALFQKLGELERYQEAREVYGLPFTQKVDLFSTLYQGKDEYKKALSSISKQTQQDENGLNLQIKERRNACDLFVISMENILGKNAIDTHFIHASRQCDQGCCINPMRMDKVGNLRETLDTKTSCNKAIGDAI